MNIDRAIRTKRIDYESGLNKSNRSAREQQELDEAMESINQAMRDGTYGVAKRRVNCEDSRE